MAKKTDLIGYCGMYCPDCPAYSHTTADLAKDLRDQFRKFKLDEAAPGLAKIPQFKAFKHYKNACDLLNTIAKMRCKGACRTGGGDPGCKMRKCAKKKKLAGCWLCDELTTCKNLKVLLDFGDTNYLKNLRKIKKIGPAAYVKTKTL